MREAKMYETDNGRAHGAEFVMGVICGAAVGAAVGLLFAPRAGAELRGQLADSADRLRRRASETYDKASSAVNDIVDRGRDAAQRGREKFNEARTNVENFSADMDRH